VHSCTFFGALSGEFKKLPFRKLLITLELHFLILHL
jgi:hypothetical protein